jgi:hypothetical protein
MNALLDAALGDGHIAPMPGTLDVALSTTLPSDSGTGVTEPSGGSYAAAVVANTTANWPNASARTKSNGSTIAFPTPTGTWGLIQWFALYDNGVAHSPSTFRGWGELNVPRNIDATTGAVSFGAGELVAAGPG